MKIIGIIAEFNPFHRGHAFLINHAKNVLKADCVIVAMSGNFVQRGEPAVLDKFERTRMALACGADLIFELPVEFATASAREFASAGVALLEKTGIVDGLLFGTEGISAPKALLPAARGLLSEDTAYQEALREGLRSGASFPKAREAALRASGIPEAALLSSPNNILAAEYLRAILEQGASLTPCCLPRQGDGYHADSPSGSPFASATALRRMILSGEPAESLLPYVPESLFPLYESLLSERSLSATGPDSLSGMLTARLLSLSAAGTDLCDFWDVSPEIAGRLSRSAERLLSWNERVESLWTKQYTRSRISRALLHILLNIRREAAEQKKATGYISYLRLLGFSPAGRSLLPALKDQASCPIVTKAADHRELLSADIYASNLYYGLKTGLVPQCRNEYQRQIVC